MNHIQLPGSTWSFPAFQPWCLNVFKDYSHQVGGISWTGNELDSEEFCIDDIFDQRLQISGMILNGCIINKHSVLVIHL